MSDTTSNAINKFERKISVKGAARAGARFTLFISDKDMNDIIRIIKSLKDSNILIDDITETVSHEIIKKECKFLPALLALLVVSSFGFFSCKRYKWKRS